MALRGDLPADLSGVALAKPEARRAQAGLVAEAVLLDPHAIRLDRLGPLGVLPNRVVQVALP